MNEQQHLVTFVVNYKDIYILGNETKVTDNKFLLIGVSWILFVLKVMVAFDGFSADITHHGTTGTHHLVAAVLLHKLLLTFPTFSTKIVNN